MSATTPGLQTTFDDNNDDLLSLLGENWNTEFNDSKYTRDYLSRLCSLSLDELLREPHELRAEQDKMKHNAQALAFQNYPSFLQTQSCRHQVHETLDGLDVHLNDFLSSIPELKDACQVFNERASSIKDESNKIARVLEHQDILVDLLEIPQLMETCVWNGYYSEAMDLASHVRLLLVRYPLPVIKSIQQQVQASTDLMLVQLVSHLRKPLRLAPAISVVGFLRRLDVFESEMELRIVFLRCRHDFLQQRLLRVKREISEDERQRSTDAYEYLKKFLDVIREQLFEIGNQYMSVFSNEQGTLLSDYMIHTLEIVKSTLTTYLSMIEDASALTSILTQLQYCGMSLGRIGLDFRQIMVDAFEDALRPILFKRIDRATEELVHVIIQSAEESAVPSTWMSSKLISHYAQETKTQTFQPPMLLVSYPTLAIFTNGILTVFNSLRHLPALNLYQPIQDHLEACFLEIGGALKQYSDQAASHIPDEITHLQSFAAAYVRCCIPFLKSCLSDGIYNDLSVHTTTDDDMEALLADYLPVIEKSFDKDMEKKVEDDETHEESQTDLVINSKVKEEEEKEEEKAEENNEVKEKDEKAETINQVKEEEEEEEQTKLKEESKEEDAKTKVNNEPKEEKEKTDLNNKVKEEPKEEDPELSSTIEGTSKAKELSTVIKNKEIEQTDNNNANDDTQHEKTLNNTNHTQPSAANKVDEEVSDDMNSGPAENDSEIVPDVKEKNDEENASTQINQEAVKEEEESNMKDSISDPLGANDTSKQEESNENNTSLPTKDATNGKETKKKNHKGKKHKGRR